MPTPSIHPAPPEGEPTGIPPGQTDPLDRPQSETSPPGRDAMGEALGAVLALTLRVTLETVGGLWNGGGPAALTLRPLLAAQRDELWGGLDAIAERLRQIDRPAPPLPAPVDPASVWADAARLHAAHRSLAEVLRAAIDVARAQDDEGAAHVLLQRLVAHETHARMLGLAIA